MYVLIDRNSNVSIKKQLYDGIIELIFSGSLNEGDKVPSTRGLSLDLNIARNSVIEIYEQLVAEGYFYCVKGRGTFVSMVMHEKRQIHTAELDTRDDDQYKGVEDEEYDHINLYPGTPDLEHFPSRFWLKYLKDYFYGPSNKILGFSEFKGYIPLRNELVKYLRKHKGITCRNDQVFITNGTSGALNQIALTLMHSHHHMLTEEYVIDLVPNIFWCHGFKVEGISVDDQGMVVSEIPNKSSSHLIYTAPAHHMPVGGIMPVSRRQELIQYASKGNHIIIEDDYDSEFRHVGAPVNALKQIDADCVIYLGTFSKTLGPGLRIGYMVVPDSLLEVFNHAYRKSYGHVQVMDQYCLYRLLSEGQYEKHIYKMTRIYKKKSEQLMSSINKYIKEPIEIIGRESGLHISLRYKNRRFNIQDKRVFETVGLMIDYVEDYAIDLGDKTTTNTIVIGFGHLSLDEIEEGIKRLSMIENKE